MRDYRKNNNNVIGLVLSVLTLSVIIVFIWLGHTDNTTKIFDPGSYYYGIHKNEEIPSPLEMRNRMVIIKKGEEENTTTKCNPAFVKQENGLLEINNGLYAPTIETNIDNKFGSNLTELTPEQLNEIFNKENESTDRWYCWKNSSTVTPENYIISPMTVFKFSEYNNEVYVDEKHGRCIAIAPQSSDTQRILFCNIVNWYCNLDTMEEVTKHDSFVGYSSDNSFKYGSYSGDKPVVLGTANANTYMIFQKRDSVDDEWIDCPAVDYYNKQ